MLFGKFASFEQDEDETRAPLGSCTPLIGPINRILIQGPIKGMVTFGGLSRDPSKLMNFIIFEPSWVRENSISY